MSEAFKKAAAKPVRSISTRAELLLRQKARAKPALTHQLTPRGMGAAQVHKYVDQRNEQRIKTISETLQGAKAKLARGNAYAAQHGKAKADFGRAR